MKVGDLVNFYTVFFTEAAVSYNNPGLIVDIDRSHRQTRYTVVWSDGRITNEHSGYLQKVPDAK